MKRRPPPPTPPGFFTTHDLKGRGWTPRLIRDFLPLHDAERPNGLKVGRKRLPPVKLYGEERVRELEGDEDFLSAQYRAMEARERAERARETRRLNRERALRAAADAWTPRVEARPIRKGAVRQARTPHAAEMERALSRAEAGLGRLSGPERRWLKTRLALRLDAALSAVYPWFLAPALED